MSILNILAKFIQETSYDQLPEMVTQSTKMRVLDFLAVALSGYKYGIHKPFLQMFKPSAGSKEATIIGEGVKFLANHAALINSSMCPADLTDGSRFAGLHPSPIVIPAALATFEAYNKTARRSGQDLLLAIALGYEVMIRVGQAMNPAAVKRGFHLTGIVGPLGSAAAVGKLIGLDQTGQVNALSIATISGSGLLHAFKAPEPFVEIQVARSCEAGVFSALCAQAGVKGNNKILEEAFLPAFTDEYHSDLITKDLGQEYMVPKTYIKMHAGCRHIHAPIDGALYIKNQYGIDWPDIEGIKVKTYSVALDLEIDHPQTGGEAKFNIPFGIAMGLIQGNVFYDKFTEENLRDERIQRLMGKVTVELDPELDQGYPAKRGAKVEITTKKGQKFSHALDGARGEPEFPFSRSEIEEKFQNVSAGLIDGKASQRIIDFVNQLESRNELSELFKNLQISQR